VPLCLGAAVPSLPAQAPSLTIYSDGRVLVRRAVPAAVARGVTTVPVDLGVRDVDAGSLAVLDSGVTLRGVRVVQATGLDGSLLRALGGAVEFQVGHDSAPRYVRGTLLSLTPPTVRVDGRVRYGFPGTPVFPDSLVQLAPRTELTVESPRALTTLSLLYLTGGLQWQATYSVTVPRSGAGPSSVTGSAIIQNPGMVSLRGAQVQLLAGDVRRAAVPRAPAMVVAQARALEADAAAAPSEEAVGGTHVYTLPGAVDLVPGETRTVALFARAVTRAEPWYFLRPVPGYGPMNPWPEPQRDLHPDVEYRIAREVRTPFGQTPLPGGIVRVYAPDTAGRAQLLGEAGLDHTPAGRELRLVTGTAFDLTATRTQTEFDRRGDRESISAYRVTLRNARGERVVVQVEDRFPTEWELLASTVPGERPSARSVRFPVAVPSGGEATLEYRVRLRW
jgi:hypothetical protein